MAKLTHYGFIIMGDAYLPDHHKATLTSELFKSDVIAVEHMDDAISAAKKMVADGVQVIELCGGFGQSGAIKIINAINCKVPVGYVSFYGYEHDKLTDFLASEEPKLS